MELPAGIAAEAALTRQGAALSLIKHSAEQSQAIAEVIDQAARTAPVSSARGSNVNTTA